MPRRDTDPYASYNFRLEIDGINVAGFSECSGLNAETTPIEYREGHEALTARKLPGLIKYGNVTLKRGVIPISVENGPICLMKLVDKSGNSLGQPIVSQKAKHPLGRLPERA